VDIELTRGTTNPIEVTFTNPILGENYNIAADTILMTVKESYTAAVAFLTKTNLPGEHSAPLDGKTIIIISKAEIEDAPNEGTLRVLYYEIRRIVPAPASDTVFFSGYFKIYPTAKPV
jgi:hypothetical protein